MYWIEEVMERSASMPQQRATSANNGLPQRFGTSPRLVFDTFRFVTSIAGQSRAKSFGHAERRQALTLCAMAWTLSTMDPQIMVRWEEVMESRKRRRVQLGCKMWSQILLCSTLPNSAPILLRWFEIGIWKLGCK